MIYGYFNATGYLKKALESLQAVSIQHLFEKAVENKDEEIEPTQTRHSTTSCDNLANSNYFNCSQASKPSTQKFQFFKKYSAIRLN